MSTPFIQALIPHLPRYAEEEGYFYPVPRTALVDALCQAQLDRAAAETVVGLVETLLDTLAVLDTDSLQKGEWCWVSFPAQLLALSVLTAWGDPNSRFFASNFWNTRDIADAKKEQQREVLHHLETRRYEHHANRAAQPIRYIYVAWGIIKLDDKVLFYQREDTQKRHDKQAGDYGLIGGRLNQRDVPGNWRDLLGELQSANSALIKVALPETLKRELHEEAGLVFARHYQFKPWRCIRPYQQVQGSAPNHGLTHYYLEVFHIELTLDGYLFLQQQVKRDERLAWFSLDEMIQGATSDGKIPYINALLNDFDNGPLALKAELSALPDSFTAGYLFPREKYGLTLLMNNEKPILAGVLGKEKILDKVLTQEQMALLLGLAAHGRGFEFSAITDNVTLHPYGWVDVSQNRHLQTGLIELAAALKGTDVIIECHRDVLFRLSVHPAMVYFDDQLFTFAVKAADLNGVATKIPVQIHRAAFTTALGSIKEITETFQITLEFAHKLRSLAFNTCAKDDALNIEDTYKKGLHKKDKFLRLGLKSLIRQEAGNMKFNLQYTIS